MADFIPQKIGEQYHFLSPGAQLDYDKIRTLLGRYWDIGSAFGFQYNKPTVPMTQKSNASLIKAIPVMQSLAMKKIQLSIIPDFTAIALKKYDFFAATTNIIAAKNTEPLGPAFPQQEQKYRTRFLKVPKFPKEYFTFKPEASPKDNMRPLIYSSDQISALTRNINELKAHETKKIDSLATRVESTKTRAVITKMRDSGGLTYKNLKRAGVADDEIKTINAQISTEQSALRWAKIAAENNDGSQYEVHNIFLNSYQIGAKEVTKLEESQTLGSTEFENPWKPTKAFQVPLYKVVTKLTNELLDSTVNGSVAYEDFVFNFPRPLSRNVIDKMNAGTSRIRYGSADEKCEYNYYIENYERVLENMTITERVAPNVYAINMMQYFTEKGPLNATEWQRIYDPSLYHIVSCGDKISQEKIQFKVARNDASALKSHRKVGKVRKSKGDTNSNSAYVEYLEEWRTNQDLQNEADIEIANDKNRNIIFSAKDYNFLQEVSSKSSNLPMCARIEFAVESNHHKSDSITEIFRKSNCLSSLMIKAMEHTRPTEGMGALNTSAKNLWSNQDFNYFAQKLQNSEDGTPMGWLNEEMSTVTVPNFDLRVFLEQMTNSGVDMVLDGLSEHYYTLIHDGYEMNPFSHSDTRKATQAKIQMNAFLINGMMHNLVDKKLRSFSDIMHGKMAQTEVVFYEIEKVKTSGNGQSEVIQTFWVPNFAGRETIELVDSQVKYDSLYQYNVYAWTAIFGNNYRYDTAIGFNQKSVYTPKEAIGIQRKSENKKFNPKVKEDGWKIGVINRPTLKLARLPYYEFDPIRIIDNPPISPQVDIVPYRAVNNKIKINLNPSVDDYRALPITLGTSDFSNFLKNYQGQYGALDASVLSDRFLATGKAEIPLHFKADDLPKWFQIYRIGFAPSSWNDFEGAMHTMLDAEAGDTSFVDQITPNETYYYTFRSVDVHSNISNPSNILKVKLVDDQGIFPLIEPYDFEQTQRLDRGFKKKVRRFFQITPVFEQLVYKEERQEEEATTIANQRNIRLGVAKDSIYGKRLKFRITSKKSGRKIDLNVSFTHKHLKPPRRG